MHEAPVNRLGGLSLLRKSGVRLTDRPDMTLDVYHGRKTTTELMIGHRMSFYGNIHMIIPKLSLLPLLIWSTADELGHLDLLFSNSIIFIFRA